MLCLQETKVANFSVTMANDLMGSSFDYVYLPSVGGARWWRGVVTSGRGLILWYAPS